MSIRLFSVICGVTILIVGMNSGCSEKSGPLLPYTGSPSMSQIVVEEGTFLPKITWVGGYVSVLGINTGRRVALDSTLVWLIYKPGDAINYPVKYHTMPSGAEDLTSQYGGITLDSLIEDSTYTFWVMKENLWAQLSDKVGKIISIDSALTGSATTVNGDTLSVSQDLHTQKIQALDVYINIKEIKSVGRLATIFVEQPRTSNNPRIWWQIKQSGVTDSLIAAIGIVTGQEYKISKLIWEVYSVDSTSGQKVYGKNDVIQGPLVAGQNIDGTHAFVKYPTGGLKRNTYYYIWIANKDWDGEKRLRSTNYYAYVTFYSW